MESTWQIRPTKIMVDLEAIKSNVMNLKERLQSNVQIIAVVKANAYGHGDVKVAQAAMDAGATMLAVATPDEAMHLRQHFETAPIIVLGASPVHFAQMAAANNISLTVFSADWINELPTLEHVLKLHIKIDSGMGRIGVTNEAQLMELYNEAVKTKNIEIEGIFTHFATADDEDTLHFDNQITMFQKMLNVLPEKPRLVHVANTATALVKDASYQYDAVRYGISLYGLSPSPYVETVLPFELKPAMSIETELVHVKQIQVGDTVGYGATFVATEPCYIGTLPIGYADGVLRKLSGMDVLVGGKRAKIVGRVCMDQCMVLLEEKFEVGERVVLIGQMGDEKISFDDWATKLETINYELPCILTNRLPRNYK
jgi:alanine racemase